MTQSIIKHNPLLDKEIEEFCNGVDEVLTKIRNLFRG